MGKQVTIASGFSSVGLPQSGNSSKPFSAGQTAVLTEAEYAALPASVTRALTGVTTVAEPSRPSTDPNAKSINTVAGATGTVALKSGGNKLALVGNVTVTFPTTATVGTSTEVDAVFTQDATGSRLLTLPASAKAAGGTAPVLSTGANKSDYLKWKTFDGGATWLLVEKQLDVR